MKVLLTNSYFLEVGLNGRRIMKPYPPRGVLSLFASRFSPRDQNAPVTTHLRDGIKVAIAWPKVATGRS